MHAFPYQEFAAKMVARGYSVDYSGEKPPMLTGALRIPAAWGDVPVKLIVYSDWEQSRYWVDIKTETAPALVGQVELIRHHHGWRLSYKHDWAAWMLGKETDLNRREPEIILWGQS